MRALSPNQGISMSPRKYGDRFTTFGLHWPGSLCQGDPTPRQKASQGYELFLPGVSGFKAPDVRLSSLLLVSFKHFRHEKARSWT